MANRKQAPLEVVSEHTAYIEQAATARETALTELSKADDDLRLAIKDAFEVGITAGPIKKASRLSESRLYQIRDGRRH